jgi:hypothetical protein
MTQYVRRLLVFNCLWMIAVIVASFFAQLVASDPDFVDVWFVAFSPISYVVGLVFSAPLAITIGLLTWVVSDMSKANRRLVAIASTLVVWTAVIAIAAIARPYDSRTILESAFTLGVSIPLFALLMPLPEFGEGPSTPTLTRLKTL